MEYEVGDVVKTKKTHPCGTNQWEITRVGLDFKLKCLRLWPYYYGYERKSIENDKRKS